MSKKYSKYNNAVFVFIVVISQHILSHRYDNATSWTYRTSLEWNIPFILYF